MIYLFLSLSTALMFSEACLPLTRPSNYYLSASFLLRLPLCRLTHSPEHKNTPCKFLSQQKILRDIMMMRHGEQKSVKKAHTHTHTSVRTHAHFVLFSSQFVFKISIFWGIKLSSALSEKYIRETDYYYPG